MRYRPVTQSAEGASSVIRINSQQPNFKLGLFVELATDATLTYTVQYTYDQPEAEYATDFATDADWRSVDGLTSLTVDGASNLFYPVNAVRLNVTAYTDGEATLTVTQAM